MPTVNQLVRKGRKKTANKLDQSLAPPIVWKTGASLPTYIRNLGAAAVDGKVYAVGGYDSDVMVLHANYEYNPQKNTWTIRADMHAKVEPGCGLSGQKSLCLRRGCGG